MSTITTADEPETDYAVDALFGEETFQSVALHYGPSLRLTTATQTGKSLTLLANAVFNSALVFAEWIDRGLLEIPDHVTILELGAGTGLPSLRILQEQSRYKVSGCIITDYPSFEIMAALQSNVSSNPSRIASCDVQLVGLDWYSSHQIDHVLALNGGEGYDVILAADLLWYTDAHPALLDVMCKTLKKTSEARVYIATGRYVSRSQISNFLTQASERGMRYRELSIDNPRIRSEWMEELKSWEWVSWKGEEDVWWEGENGTRRDLSQEDLTEMKNQVWTFELRWAI